MNAVMVSMQRIDSGWLGDGTTRCSGRSSIERTVRESLYVPTLMWHRVLVVVRAHASKEHGSLPDFLRICKPSLTHERENSILRVVFQVMTGVNHARQEAILT